MVSVSRDCEFDLFIPVIVSSSLDTGALLLYRRHNHRAPDQITNHWETQRLSIHVLSTRGQQVFAQDDARVQEADVAFV